MAIVHDNELFDLLTRTRQTLEDARTRGKGDLQASLEAALRDLGMLEEALAGRAGRNKHPNSVLREPPGKKGGAKYRWGARLSELLPERSEVLDLGCGNGKPIGRLLAQRHNYTGVDIVEDRVTRLQNALPRPTILHADYTELEIPPSSFAAVVATATFAQIDSDDVVAMLGRIRKWLRPGGYLLATLGNRSLSRVVRPDIRLKNPKDDFRGPFLDAGFELLDYEIVQPQAREEGRGRRELFALAQRAG